jgi:hypothetical protein
MDDDAPQVIVCQGPPRCSLEGDEAIAAMEAGCPWCIRDTLLTSGEWHTEQPSVA